MKAVVIRHGKVAYQWRSFSTSEQFDRDCEAYDKALVTPLTVDVPVEELHKIYISSLSRSRETAVQIFGEKALVSEERLTESRLLDEVPLRASVASKTKLPLGFWNLSGRLQWIFNNPRQQETRKETIQRAEQFIQLILRDGKDCAVVTHGFFMQVLIRCMKKNGFEIEHAKLKYGNGEYIVARR